MIVTVKEWNGASLTRLHWDCWERRSLEETARDMRGRCFSTAKKTDVILYYSASQRGATHQRSEQEGERLLQPLWEIVGENLSSQTRIQGASLPWKTSTQFVFSLEMPKTFSQDTLICTWIHSFPGFSFWDFGSLKANDWAHCHCGEIILPLRFLSTSNKNKQGAEIRPLFWIKKVKVSRISCYKKIMWIYWLDGSSVQLKVCKRDKQGTSTFILLPAATLSWSAEPG